MRPRLAALRSGTTRAQSPGSSPATLGTNSKHQIFIDPSCAELAAAPPYSSGIEDTPSDGRAWYQHHSTQNSDNTPPNSPPQPFPPKLAVRGTRAPEAPGAGRPIQWDSAAVRPSSIPPNDDVRARWRPRSRQARTKSYPNPVGRQPSHTFARRPAMASVWGDQAPSPSESWGSRGSSASPGVLGLNRGTQAASTSPIRGGASPC